MNGAQPPKSNATPTMQALGVTSRPAVGSLATHLQWLELPVPTPKRHHVRVHVVGSSINIDDLHIVEGTMFGGIPLGPTPSTARPFVPGTDLAGVVDEVGPGVSHLKCGDRVYGMVPPQRGHGPWAQYCIADGRTLGVMPPDWTFAQAAGLGLAATVTCSLMAAAEPVAGRRCVVMGASGGIGSMVTAALHHAGATVVGVCSGRNRDAVLRCGASHVVDYTAGNVEQALLAAGGDYDVVVDCVGGRDVEAQARKVLRAAGAFLTICGPERYVGEKRLGWWRLTGMIAYIVRQTLFSRFSGPRYALVGPLAPDWAQVKRYLLDAGIKPQIDRVVPFERNAVAQAIAHVASHRAQGKVVLQVDAAMLEAATVAV